MKKLVLGACFLVLWTKALAQTPDPRDSIILESKTVAPNLNTTPTRPAFVIQVSITNKDSLTYMVLALGERTIAGTAYAVLGRILERTYGGAVNNLTSTLRYFTTGFFSAYNDQSPDSFLVAAGYDGSDPSTIEPPNAIRKPVWELKFERSSASVGEVLFYNTRVANYYSFFTNTVLQDISVNFLQGVLTIAAKADLNLDFAQSAADIVWLLRCVFFGTPPPRGIADCDLNCDGSRTIADVMLLLNAIFLQEPFPC